MESKSVDEAFVSFDLGFPDIAALLKGKQNHLNVKLW